MIKEEIKEKLFMHYAQMDTEAIYQQIKEINKKKANTDADAFIDEIELLHGLIKEKCPDHKLDYSGDVSMILHRHGFIGPLHFDKFYNMISCNSNYEIHFALRELWYRHSYIYSILKTYFLNDGGVYDKEINEIIYWYCYDNNKDVFNKKHNMRLLTLMKQSMVYSHIYLKYGIDADEKNWLQADGLRFSTRGKDKEITIVSD